MTRHEEDLLAVRRCLNQDPAAFRDIVERYKNQIFSLIFRLVRNSSDAEDLSQETFIKAFKNLASYDPAHPLITWLFKIAHNRAIDFLRAKKPEAVSIDEDEVGAFPEPSTPIEKELETVLRREFLDGILTSLPPLYREALILRHKEGLDLKEMVEVLQIPEGTVKIRLFRARKALKEKLESVGGEAAA